jgi:peptidoglycan/LPS O-acetylase OafA/YrhL
MDSKPSIGRKVVDAGFFVLVLIVQVVVQGWTLLAWGVSNAPPAHRHFEWRWLPVSILPELILGALVVTRFAVRRPVRPLWRPALGIAFVAALAFFPIAAAFDLMPIDGIPLP